MSNTKATIGDRVVILGQTGVLMRTRTIPTRDGTRSIHKVFMDDGTFKLTTKDPVRFDLTHDTELTINVD